MTDTITEGLDHARVPPTTNAEPVLPGPRRRSRRGLVAIAVIVILAVVAAIGFVLSRRSDQTASTKTTLPSQPVAVVKKDLATFTPYTGTLGFGDPITISEAGLSTGSASSTTGAAGGAIGTTGATGTSGATPAAATSTGGGAASGGASSATRTTTAPTTTAVPSSNTVTALAPEGVTVNRGDVIYAIDNQPRVSFYGLTPAYRDLSAAVTPGDDVLELEQNLVLLGYDPNHQITVDNTFDAGTIAAVDRWQADHGYPQNGIVQLGEIVFLPGAIRIGSHQLEIGGVARVGTPVIQATELSTTITAFAGNAGTVDGLPAPGTAVAAGTTVFTVNGQPVAVTPQQSAAGFGLAVSAHRVDDGAVVTASTPVVDLEVSHRQVTANVSVTDRATMKVGDAVRVVFPDASQKPGSIAAIGSVAAKTSNNANATPTVPVTVVLTQDQIDPNLVSTPVEVDFTQDQAKGALAVPTGALVALKEGGFAVMVQDASGSTHLVAVKPGIYSDGLVQITGNGIAEGTKVMVPS